MKTAKHPSIPGTKWDRRETANVWRRGLVYRFSEVADMFVETSEWVTIKPGEKLLDAENAVDGYIGIVDG